MDKIILTNDIFSKHLSCMCVPIDYDAYRFFGDVSNSKGKKYYCSYTNIEFIYSIDEKTDFFLEMEEKFNDLELILDPHVYAVFEVDLLPRLHKFFNQQIEKYKDCTVIRNFVNTYMELELIAIEKQMPIIFHW